uniref:Uncharacterized protein n=1 Tax=Candidatus Kentrum sp. LFY TaxID=2126342 RepID=A0A450UDP6_9GAMM|nr:MAG: hypothetical protein BECKLFY1418A_GA0070994_101233 [Candidatus Kentron sp. LFY]
MLEISAEMHAWFIEVRSPEFPADPQVPLPFLPESLSRYSWSTAVLSDSRPTASHNKAKNRVM